jgi:MFS family permease
MREYFKDRVFQITLIIMPLTMMGVSMINVTIPEILQSFGIIQFLSPGVINPLYGPSAGLISSVFVGAAILITPMAGAICDRFGRRPIILFSLIAFAITGPLVYLVPTFEGFILVRFLQGTSSAALFPATDILIGDRFRGKDLPKAMGYAQSMFAIGNVVFPLIGGFIGEIDWRLNFVAFTIAVPVFLLVWKYLEETKPVKQESSKIDEKASGSLKKVHDPTIYLVILSGFALPFVMMTTQGTFVPILLNEQLGLSPSLRGTVSAVMWSVAAVMSLLIGGFFKTKRVTPFVTLTYIILGIGIFFYPTATTFEIVLLLSALVGIGMGSIRPLLRALIIQVSPKELKGTLVSVRATLQRVGQTVGPLFFGLVYTGVGLAGIFGVLSGTAFLFVGILIVSMIFAPIYYRTRPRPGDKIEESMQKKSSDI